MCKRVAAGVVLVLCMTAATASAQIQLLGAALRIVASAAQTCASNGGGTPASLTLATAQKGYILLTQNDPDGCALTLSETGAIDGDRILIVNTSANSATIADSSGVQEVNGGITITLGQYDTASMAYYSDRWVEVARSQPQVGTANAATLTNKTLDAEGTGNVLTTVERRNFPAGVCVSGSGAYEFGWSWATGGGVDAVTNGCIVGTNVTFGTIEFKDTGTGYIYRQIWLPADWTGAIDVKLAWHTSVTTNDVKWQLQTACTADNETLDPAWNTANTVVDTAKGTTNLLNTATLTAITTTGCAAGEIMWFRLLRDPTDGADTLAASAFFDFMELTLRRAQ